MTPPTGDDLRHDDSSAEDQFRALSDRGEKWCYASLDEVRRNLAATGYDPRNLHFVKGPVENTIPEGAPNEIALLRLDTDWYESTKHELLHLYPRLAPRGVLIIDDYGHWKGSRKATDEYLQANGIVTMLHRVDQTSRMVIKG
jgi:O-methyltransferase